MNETPKELLLQIAVKTRYVLLATVDGKQRLAGEFLEEAEAIEYGNNLCRMNGGGVLQDSEGRYIMQVV